MKLANLLVESYSTAKSVFGRQGADPEEVQQALDRFKELSTKNLVKGADKDLTTWIRKGWQEFRSFVSDHANTQSNRSQKTAQKKDSIVVREDDKILVVIPLTKDASCFYGRDTKWCTAATESGNKFNEYFRNLKVVLFYAIDKETGERHALALHSTGTAEAYDDTDSPETPEDFYAFAKMNGTMVRKAAQQYASQIRQYADKPVSDEEYEQDATLSDMLERGLDAPGRWAPFENRILRDVINDPDNENALINYAAEYAKEKIGRWPEFEKAVLSQMKSGAFDSDPPMLYIDDVIGGRWKELEDLYIEKQDAYNFLRYLNALKNRERVPALEKMLLGDDENYDLAVSYAYARASGWPALEQAMYKTAQEKGPQMVRDDFAKYMDRFKGKLHTEEGKKLQQLLSR